MRLNGRDIALVLDDAGREVLALAHVDVRDAPALRVLIEDTDDVGLWARIGREDGDHVVLVRWEYVLSIDFLVGDARTVGLR
jgi:hypothetical protein